MFGFKSKKKENKEEIQEEKIGFFKRLKQGLAKTRSGLTGRLDRLFLGKREIDEDLLDELEEILFTSDLGVSASQELIELVREGVARKSLGNPEQLKAALKEKIMEFLNIEEPEVKQPGPGEPLDRSKRCNSLYKSR